MVRSENEFPLLGASGLYAADIRGDGNCLFNALSDQLYGTQSRHHEIRTRVIEYMREHAAHYKQYITVHPGGGARRNPKRKNTNAYSTPANSLPPSPEEIQSAFESHLQQMARGGTYGDNMEINAFSAAFGVDVKLYQRDFAYMVSGRKDNVKREVAHIAYHTWEHYSSIRNLDGPHTGPPQVTPKAPSPQAEREQQRQLAEAPHVLPWMVNAVTQSLPYVADRAAIQRTLEECKGSIDNAVSKLLDAEERGSVSSAQTSSSIERDADSDDDDLYAPNKRQTHHRPRPSRDLAIRLKLSSPTKLNQSTPDATTSTTSTTTTTTSASHLKPGPKTQTLTQIHSQTQTQPQQKQPSQGGGSKPKRVTARDRKETKKAAQKAAAKERKKGAGGGGGGGGGGGVMVGVGKENAPVLDVGIKVLYI